MKKLLNTLYITTPDAYLARDGLNIVVLVENKEKFRVPIHNIESVITFGWSGASPALLALCAENKVSISFLTPTGFFCGRVEGPIKGNVLLRKQQFRLVDNQSFTINLVKTFILAKIANCRNVVHRVLRDHGNEINEIPLKTTLYLLQQYIAKVEKAQTVDAIRGIEGIAANDYFNVFNHFIVTNKSYFIFSGRNRRPPRDPVNALLSFSYSLLAHEVQSALESVGLDPYVGFLHTDRPGRPSLALDLMEELRPYMADRLVLSLINRNQINANGIINQKGFGYLLDEESRKVFLSAWQKRKQDEITHPFLREKINIGLIPYVQSLLLARHIRGDIEMYPAFIMK
ncbi:MAG: CRISP-associated protein Cas1 [Epulopiscium sp.]|jgi:CRISPR-associated protein Cas1|nr:CRISP-associated protein Cas1 [Eubacteriaceae bacterium]MDK2788569.1 CRISP-associated protein Cas1 [Candidatus Epulonipiscium sp.]